MFYLYLPNRLDDEPVHGNANTMRAICLYAMALSLCPARTSLNNDFGLYGFKSICWYYIGYGEELRRDYRGKWENAFKEMEKRGWVQFIQGDGPRKPMWCFVRNLRITRFFTLVGMEVMKKIFDEDNVTLTERPANSMEEDVVLTFEKADYWTDKDGKRHWKDWEGAFYTYFYVKSFMRKNVVEMHQSTIAAHLQGVLARERVFKNLKWLRAVGIFERTSVPKKGAAPEDLIFEWREAISSE